MRRYEGASTVLTSERPDKPIVLRRAERDRAYEGSRGKLEYAMDSKGDVRSSSAPDADGHVVEQRVMGESHTSDSAGFELFGLLWGAMGGGAGGYRAFGWMGGIGGGYAGVVVSQICSRLPRLRQYDVYTLFAAFESWGLMLGLMLGLGFSHSPWVRPTWLARIGVMIPWAWPGGSVGGFPP